MNEGGWGWEGGLPCPTCALGLKVGHLCGAKRRFWGTQGLSPIPGTRLPLCLEAASLLTLTPHPLSAHPLHGVEGQEPGEDIHGEGVEGERGCKP